MRPLPALALAALGTLAPVSTGAQESEDAPALLVHGSLVSPSGAPLAGVEVTMVVLLPDDGSVVPAAPVHTDARGAFELFGERPSAPVWIEVWAGNRDDLGPARWVLTEIGPGGVDLGATVLRPAVELRGRVVDGDGIPAPGTWKVTFESRGGEEDGPHRFGTCAEIEVDPGSGEFRLPVAWGPGLLTASTDPGLPGERREIHAHAGLEALEIVTAVDPRAYLVVQPHFPWPGSHPVAAELRGRLRVRLEDPSGESVPPPRVDGLGRFVFGPLADGPHRLVVEEGRSVRRCERGGLQPGERLELDLEGHLDLTIAYRPAPGGAPLTFRAWLEVGADRVPLTRLRPGPAGATRIEGLLASGPGAVLVLGAKDHPEGRFPLSDLPLDAPVLELVAPRYARLAVTLDASAGPLADRTVTLELTPGERPGVPAGPAGVGIGRDAWPLVQEARRVDPRGEPVLTGLAPGRYTLRAWWGPLEWTDAVVQVAGEATRVELVRPRPAEVRVPRELALPQGARLVLRNDASLRSYPRDDDFTGVELLGGERLAVTPGLLDLRLQYRGHDLTWNLPGLEAVPGAGVELSVDPALFPAEVHWSVLVDGEPAGVASLGSDYLTARVDVPARATPLGGYLRWACVALLAPGEHRLQFQDPAGTWLWRDPEVFVAPAGASLEHTVRVDRVHGEVRVVDEAGDPVAGERLVVELGIAGSDGRTRTRHSRARSDAQGIVRLALAPGTLVLWDARFERVSEPLDWGAGSVRGRPDAVLRPR